MRLLLIAIALTLVSATYAQSEEPPVREYHFTIGLNSMKTQEEADKAEASLKQIEQIKDCDIKFLEYELIFNCTNIDMQEYKIMDRIKAILTEEGIEITTIEKVEVVR